MPEVVAVDPVLRRHRLRDLRGRRLRRGVLGPPRRRCRAGRPPRAVVAHSIGPVWEANHVWLIFCLVVLWTGFSEAFASITLTLFVPLSLAALGIVLRGSSFAFRKEVTLTSSRRNFGAAFAISSVIVPFCMGAVAGAIASGRVPSGGKAGDPWDSWLNPTSILGGRARGHGVRVPRRGLPLLRRPALGRGRHGRVLPPPRGRDGDRHRCGRHHRHLPPARGLPYVFDGLTSRALPLVIVSALCGVGSLVLLLRNAARGRADAGHRRGGHRGARLGRRAVGLHPPGDAHGLPGRRARVDARDDPRRVHGRRDRDPAALGLLYMLDQKSLLEPDPE